MKLKRLLIYTALGLAFLSPVMLTSCGNSSAKEDNQVDPVEPEDPTEPIDEEEPSDDSTPTIYLAGDSTVKTYNTDQYIAGWGQYMDLFLDDIEVKNWAHGGRSSRSFINEGRLYDIPGSSFTFSENGGNSIGDEIKEGDYLFIQFGHNDDNTKFLSSPASNYSTVYDRMVQLGTPDSNGIYPTTEAEKVATTSLPTAYTEYADDSAEASALATIQKYGSTYYSYDNGTYKWYLKQYIDFARDKGATPVLVTPVARVSFDSDGNIKSGPGLHGEDFAYVKAVRQLAEEEGCLLMDMFAETKNMLETATQSQANYLMALKPNGLTGEWRKGYDYAYQNTDEGYEGIEATHYNKYGAYLTAAAMAKELLENKDVITTSKETITFDTRIETTPEDYIDPSNLMTRATVSKLEGLFTTVEVTNPNRTSLAASEIDPLIEALPSLDEINNENYEAIGEDCVEIRKKIAEVNVDDKSGITLLSTLEAVEAKVALLVEANRPTPTSTVVTNFESLTANSTITTATTLGDFTIVGTEAKEITVKANGTSFTHNGIDYTTTKCLSMGGSATYGTARYVEFTTSAACSVTVVCQSTGTAARAASIVSSSSTSTVLGTFTAGTTATKTTVDLTTAGTYQIGSTGSGIYIYAIIIEYFN